MRRCIDVVASPADGGLSRKQTRRRAVARDACNNRWKERHMDPVVHFEMPFDDQQRVLKFYQSAFGWGMHALGEEMGNYVLATTAASDEQGRPKESGRINGGLFPKRSDWPAQYPNIVIAVDD